MKHLTLIRHAKSSWKNPSLMDHDRPLNKRGKQNAPLMGQLLKKQHRQADAIFSSSARRALDTAHIISQEIGFPTHQIQKEERLYLISLPDLLSFIQECDQALNHILLFGHNPTFTHAINHLTEITLDNLPTCGVATIEFAGQDWSSFDDNPGELLYLDYPKNHLLS